MNLRQKKSLDDKVTHNTIRIKTLNISFMILTCIVYAFLMGLTFQAFQNFENLKMTTNDYIACQRAKQQVREASDFLTEQVRLFAITGDRAYMEEYFNEAKVRKNRDDAFNDLKQHQADEAQKEQMKLALEESTALMNDEYYSMFITAWAFDLDLSQFPEEVSALQLKKEHQNLNDKELKDLAVSMVFDEDYRNHKEKIYNHLEQLAELLINDTEYSIDGGTTELSNTLSGQRVMLCILLILDFLMNIFILLFVIKPLVIFRNNIEEDKAMEMVGAYELQYLAAIYNKLYEANKENRNALLFASEHDHLTGTLNRTAFEKITSELKYFPIPIALMIIDVDCFKDINDKYGHDVGDKILQKISYTLKSSVRMSDNVIRYGGDEFVVIMHGAVMANKQLIEDKINGINHSLMNPTDDLPPASISAGIAFSQNGYSEELLHNGDEALYCVKKNGRAGCKTSEKVL